MKKIIYLLAAQLFLLSGISVYAQTTGMNPADPDVIYTASNQPAAPAWNNYNIVKWGHTNRLSWGPFNLGYKSYIYQGMAFRLKFPKTYAHNVADGKKYPLFIFFQGRGEAGTIYDNELHLTHGGQLHAQKVNDGTFDGFLFYAQSTSGNSQDYFPRISLMIDSLVRSYKVDIDRVIISGLSAGGQASWEFIQNNTYNKKVAASLPISAASTQYPQYFQNHITVPIWVSNGGQDAAPAAYTVTQVVDAYRNLGGKIDQSFYPDQGHSVWGSFWGQSSYWPYLNAAHKANPLVYFQRNEYCPNITIDAKLQVNAGFFAYEWQKNGSTIAGAVTNTLQVNSYGTYAARFKRTSTSDWSAWSPSPAVISQKQATITPPIVPDGSFSTVLPSPDGSTTVPLTVPGNFSAYEWRRVSDNAVVSTASTYVAGVGQYKLKVTEQYGCSSSFSAPYAVIAANGANVPDKASNVSAAAKSSTVIELNWSDNPTPVNNETGFEIYRSTTAGSNYKLANIVGADALVYADSNLNSNTPYYYIIRAINNNGASAISSEVTATTKSDVTLPTAPTNVKITGTSRTSISLAWTASTDDVGVAKYDVYVNGVKAYSTSNTSIIVGNLTPFQTYALYVRARDLSGNLSPKSNQVSSIAALTGLYYRYYEGTWTILPDFNALTPVKTGIVPSVVLTPRNLNDRFGFVFEGYINIPVTGSYTFELSSDDGSKLYLGQYSFDATALVNHDGAHNSSTYKATTITLNKGTYPFAVAYFEGTGAGEICNVWWTSTAAGINSRQLIPASAFSDVVPAVTAPAAPSQLTVTPTSYKAITIGWTDNSNDETGFEIVRADSLSGAYVPVGTAGAGATSFVDSIGLNAGTEYYYKVKSISQSSQSDFTGIVEGRWALNNSYADAVVTSRVLTAVGTPAFNAADKKEGSHSLSTTGAQGTTMAFSSARAFPSNEYNTRTVAVWIKPIATNISAANKIIFDLGSSDNGLSLRFNSGSLQVGVASASVRSTLVLNTVATNANWVVNGWNHVAVVYNKNVVTLYLNGVNKGSTSLSFSSILSTTGLSGLGVTNGANAFNSSTSSTHYNGLMDDFIILKEALTAFDVTSLMNDTYGSATTQALPAAPASPAVSAVTATSPSSIQLTFSDNSSNETGFDIYRATTTNETFRLLATIAGGNTSSVNYTDNNLFANTNYFYKVVATGIGGNSTASNEGTAKTLNNAPKVAPVDGFTMRYDSQKNLSISATDGDGDAVTLSFADPLPSFATFTPGGNGSGSLQLSPATADAGTYNFRVVATDVNNGKDTAVFAVTVNGNYVPVISAISNVNINEGTTSNVALTATDQDGNGTLVYSLVSGPSFATLTDNGNGSASVALAPGYAASGSYTITVSVADGSGGVQSSSFNVTVANVTPTSQTVYMSMKYQSANALAPWNNIASTNTNNLLDGNGQASGIGIQFLGTPWNAGDAGAVTGNNSGVYPDAVIRDYFWFGAYGNPETVTFNLNGLTPAKKYNVTLFGSSAWTGLGNNGTTVYTINGVQKPLYVDNNNQNTVTFANQTPNASGIISVTMSKGTNTPYGVLTAVVLQQPFDDGTAPVLPTNVTGEVLANGSVILNWSDVAYNEDRYLVYRSSTIDGSYSLLNAGVNNANDVTYTDNSVASSSTYYYKLEAVNANGSSGLTSPVKVVTTNKPPVLATIANVSLKAGQSTSVNISATDDATDVLTTTVTGLPSFASFQSTGNGTGTISINPTAEQLGIYKNIVVTVTDNSGASATSTFSIAVTDPNIRSVYVNFAPNSLEGGVAQPAPWNNWLSYPYPNAPLSSLKDDANVTTNFSVRLLEQWSGNFNLGMTKGDNSGIFPDAVMKSSIYYTGTAARSIQITGLDPAKRYNIVTFGSHNSGPTAQFTLAGGGQTQALETRYNDSKAVQVNGLTPTSAGTITVTMTKTSSAIYMNLNAMVIQEYAPAATLLSPNNLFAETALDTSKINLVWSDRSSDETGFRIVRSTSPNGTFVQVGTVGANVTTYGDATAKTNIRYFYKVQAYSLFSSGSFSNLGTNILAPAITFINFNSNPAQNAPIPWNNTNGPSGEGVTLKNLMDNSFSLTSSEFVITKEFNGAGFAGSTGAGVFPSVVMESNYWTDAGQLSQFKLNNLDVRKKYRIGLFGSAIFQGYSIANYTCNGKTVELNSYSNNSKVVYLTDITPNEDGELVIDCRTTAGSPYSFTGAVTIESFDDPISYSLPVTSRMATAATTKKGGATTGSASATDVAATQAERNAVNNSGTGEINVYPNPFTERFTVEISAKKAASVTVLLYDMNSKLVYRNTFAAGAGKNLLNVDPNGSVLSKGSYMLQILTDGQLSKSVKIMKLL